MTSTLWKIREVLYGLRMSGIRTFTSGMVSAHWGASMPRRMLPTSGEIASLLRRHQREFGIAPIPIPITARRRQKSWTFTENEHHEAYRRAGP